MPHSEATIAALAASIQHKGLIQNIVIEPEIKDGEPTGCYLVTAGEGRRLAYQLRAKRKEIKKNHPVRCWLDTENDPSEISLDENVTRENMHPADQFERFTKAHIASAVREAVSSEAAGRIMPMKKPDMADAAEQLVAATGWLPTLLRTPEPVLADMSETDGREPIEQPSEAQAPDTEAEDGEVHYAVAAE